MNSDQIIIGCVILLFLTIGLLIKRNKITNIAEFSLNRNNLKWFPIASGISMTFAGGASILNMSSLGYTFSWYTLVDPIAIIIGIIIVLIFIKKYRDDRGITISDLLAKSNTKLSLLIGLITTVVFILFISAQFVALSKLLIPYFPNVHPALLTIIPSTLIFYYVFWGGFSSVTRTDILQLISVMAFLVMPIFFFWLFKGGFIFQNENAPFNEFQKMPLNLIVLLSFPLLYIPISQDINIRVKSASTINQTRTGLILGAIFYTLIICSSTYIGIFLAQNGVVLDDTEKAFSVFFKNYFPKIGICAVVAALAAIISSLDSYSLNAITSISNDFFLKTPQLKKYNHKILINISCIIVYALSMLIALYFNIVLGLILTALLLYISTLVPMAVGKGLKLSDTIIFSHSISVLSIIVVLEVLRIDIPLKAVSYPLSSLALIILIYVIMKIKGIRG